MARRPQVLGLDGFRLTVPALTRLGQRQVTISIQLRGKTVSQLTHLPPKERDIKLRVALANQLEKMMQDFPEVEFISRGKRKASWTIRVELKCFRGSAPHECDPSIGGCRRLRGGLPWAAKAGRNEAEPVSAQRLTRTRALTPDP